MTVHDLGPLGTADVVQKKYLHVLINMPWEQFSLKFAAELADLSTGTIAILQEALIRRKDIKIKKEGDELDRFFNKVEAAQKRSSYGSGAEERGEVPKAEKHKGEQIDQGTVASSTKTTTYDKTTGRPEGQVDLKDGNMEGLLVPIVVEEQIKSHLSHAGKIVEDELISGLFKIQNPSKRDRLWDIAIKLKDIGSTSMEDEQIHFQELDPEQETQQEYTIKAGKIQKHLEVTEFVSTLNNAGKESHALKVGEENTVYFKITLKNVSEAKLTEIQVMKGISEGFSDVAILSSTSGMAMEEKGNLVWTLEELEANSEATMEVRMIAKIAAKDTMLKSGAINVSYKAPTSISGMGIEKFDAYTNNRFFIELGELVEHPDTFDCQLVFQNTSEFIIRLVNADVYDPTDASKKFVDIDPGEIPPLPAGSWWTSPKWISPLYNKGPGIRGNFRKGKEIKALSGYGNYEITLFVENTGVYNLEGITVLDRVPDSFQYMDFKPKEPEIVDVDGQNALSWRLDELKPNEKCELTYKISGQGEYAVSETQFSLDPPFRKQCEFFVVADHQISTKGIIAIDDVALATVQMLADQERLVEAERLQREMQRQRRAAEEQRRREAEERAWQEAQLAEQRRREAEEQARQEAELAEQRRREAEEGARLEKLKKLIRVSESLEIAQIARYLGIAADETFDRLVDWAAEFGFTLDRQVVKFGAGKKDDFIAQLDKEFQTWGTGGKK